MIFVTLINYYYYYYYYYFKQGRQFLNVPHLSKKKKKCTTIIPCSRFSRKAHGPYKETKKVSNNVKKAQQRNSKSKNGVTLCPFKTVVLERVRESNDRVRRTYREPPESPTLILNFDVNYAVKALVEIAAEVGKKGWNFKVDPCSNESSWLRQNRVRGHSTTILSSAIAHTLMVHATSFNCTYNFHFAKHYCELSEH